MDQPDVMSMIQKDQGKAAPLDPAEIIRTSLKRQGQEDQFDNIYSQMSAALKTPHFRLVRSGNTLIFYRIVKPKDTVEFDIMTADSPRELPKNLQEIMKAMKAAGFKRGIAQTENANLVNIAKSAGIPISVQMSERMEGDQMIPSQQITVELQ